MHISNNTFLFTIYLVCAEILSLHTPYNNLSIKQSLSVANDTVYFCPKDNCLQLRGNSLRNKTIVVEGDEVLNVSIKNLRTKNLIFQSNKTTYLTVHGNNKINHLVCHGQLDFNSKSEKDQLIIYNDGYLSSLKCHGFFMHNGILTIQNKFDESKGVNCKEEFYIEKGIINITLKGASCRGIVCSKDAFFYGGVINIDFPDFILYKNAKSPKGIKIKSMGIFNGTNINCNGYIEEGIECNGDMTVESGIFNLHCLDDCIQTRGNLMVKGGNISAIITKSSLLKERKYWKNHTGGDAIDSNKGITISGGYIYAVGGGKGDHAIDSEDSTIITGGTVLAFGGIERINNIPKLSFTTDSSYYQFIRKAKKENVRKVFLLNTNSEYKLLKNGKVYLTFITPKLACEKIYIYLPGLEYNDEFEIFSGSGNSPDFISGSVISVESGTQSPGGGRRKRAGEEFSRTRSGLGFESPACH